MNDVYANPRAPGSFGGIEALRRYAHKPRKRVVEYLSTQDACTLHKPTRMRFSRRRTCAKGIADLFQIDLMDMSNLSTYNDGYSYLLNSTSENEDRLRGEQRVRTHTIRAEV